MDGASAQGLRPDPEIRTRSLRIGAVGAGMIMAECHLEAYRRAGFPVAAIASRTRARAQGVADRYGIARVHDTPEALVEDPSVEILDLRTVIPWDKEAVLKSVERTSKVLVLHEDTRTGGFGAEIAATITEEGFETLDAPVKRIAAPDSPVPFSPPLEKAYIPQVEDVVAGLKDLAEY